jgi:hypothetical protein
MLNAAQKLARIVSILHDEDQTAPPPPVWYRDTSSPVPTEPLSDVTNVEEIKRYMAHGYRTNLKRGVAESDWNAKLVKCDEIYAATTPAEKEAAIAGASYFAPEVAVNLVLGGGTQGGGFSPETIFAPWGSNFDMVQSAAWLVALPNSAGPGPSG